MKRLTFHLALLLSLAMIAAACATDTEQTTTTQTPVAAVKIGSIHPLTGGLAGAGNRMDNGAQLAVDEINAAGGIASLGGAPLELISADSTGAAEVGQSEAERLISDGVSALIGTYQSAVTTNVAAIAERDGVPLVIDVAVADSILDQGYSNVFRIQPNATSMGANGAKFLNEMAGAEIQTVAYLHDDTSFGVSVADAFELAAADYGIEVVERIPYPPFEVTDLTTEMTQATAASPDVIVITGYYNDGLLAARAATDLEADVKAVIGIAQGAFHTPQFVADFGAEAELFFNSNYHFDASDPDVQAVLEKFETTYGEPMDTEAMLAYQAIYVIADALERAGSADPAAVRAALADTNITDHFMAYPGPIAFDETGENVSAEPVLMQVIDGAVRQVFPLDLQEAEPVFPGTPWGN